MKQQNQKFDKLQQSELYQESNDSARTAEGDSRIVQAQVEDIRKAYDAYDFLRPGGTSQQFLNALSYSVDLQSLLKFRKTCCYNEAMEFVPVLIEIMDEHLKRHYNGKYLLQVWKKGGFKQFEIVLKQELHSWQIQYNYFIYKLGADEKESNFTNIVYLKDEDDDGQLDGNVLKVKDFGQDKSYTHMSISQNLLFVANAHNIKIVDVQCVMAPGEIKKLTIPKSKVITYNIEAPNQIHGLFENNHSLKGKYQMCVVETKDNQLDFVRIYVKDRNKLVLEDIEFHQQREVVHRQLCNDPIIKQKQIILQDEDQFAVSIRKSGQVDLYFNYTLVNQCDDEIFSDIDLNYDNIYLIQDNIEGKKIMTIKTMWDTRIGMDVVEDHKIKEDEWHKIFYIMICHHVKVASSICLFPTQFFVSHNKIVSMFDVINKKWSEHFVFEDEVFSICRNEKTISSLKISNLGIFLNNGVIKHIDCDEDQENWKMQEEGSQLEGKIIRIVSDWKTINTHYILTLKNHESRDETPQYNIYGFSYQNMTLINPFLRNGVITANMNILRMFSHKESAHFAIIDEDEKDITVYQNVDTHGGFNLSVDVTFKVLNFSLIIGDVHTIIQTEKEGFMILVDEYNYYKLDTVAQYICDVSVQNVTNLFVLDGCNMYKMANRNKNVKKSKPGLFFQDISDYISKKQLNCQFDLDDSIGGQCGLIDYNEDNCRFAYLTDYEEVVIVPVLHRNIIFFFGMKDRSEYMCFHKLHDKLIALDDDQYLTTWSILTGKILQRIKINQDLDLKSIQVYQCQGYDLTYKREWYQPVSLLRSKNCIVDFDEEEFYSPNLLESSLDNNSVFLKIIQKTFHLFKVIEIINQAEVKEHFSFVHPIYDDGGCQFINFSKNLNYMLERLQNSRVFLYQRVGPSSPGGLVKWQIVRRIQQFPQSISDSCNANYLFSPDMMSYLDFDKMHNQFIIKRSLDQSVQAFIPTGIMDPNEELESIIVRLFRWMDSNTILVINKDGMEKLVDIYDDFKEIAFGQVPIIDIKDYQDPKKKLHYYYQKREINVTDTDQRLKVNFQEFKSAYYIQSYKDQYELYNTLFTVDFSLNNCREKPIADLSFTFLHWRMIELMNSKNKKFNMAQIGSKEMKLLVLNILPSFNTLLHVAFKKLSVIRKVYQIAQHERQKAQLVAQKHKVAYNPANGFLVPFIRNIEGMSPLHLCFANNSIKAADTFLLNLKDEGLDNHSRAIFDTLADCVRQDLPSLGEYLDARFIQTEQIKSFKNGAVRFEDDMEYAVTQAVLWPDLKILEDQLLKPSLLDVKIKVQFLDIPAIHCFQEIEGDNFFNALANTANIELFRYKSIQTLIDYKWPLAKEYTFKFLFGPFICFHVFFVVWQNVFFGQGNIEDHKEFYINLVFSILLLFFSSYFLFNELRQLASSKFEYFASFWNYTDLLPPIMIMVTVGMHFKRLEYEVPFMTTIRSIASLLMWAKFLYFLRLFPATGYIIRILHQVIVDMKVFMLILLLVFAGYNEAFLRLSESSAPEDQFFLNYVDGLQQTYTMALGNFIVNPLYTCPQPWLGFILLITFTMLTSVVMLNLLIAIVEESFSQIHDNYELANYSERAKIISENLYLIPKYRRMTYGGPKGKYLTLATEDAEQEVDVKVINIPNKLKILEKHLEELTIVIDNSKLKINQNVAQIVDKFDTMSETIKYYQELENSKKGKSRKKVIKKEEST